MANTHLYNNNTTNTEDVSYGTTALIIEKKREQNMNTNRNIIILETKNRKKPT